MHKCINAWINETINLLSSSSKVIFIQISVGPDTPAPSRLMYHTPVHGVTASRLLGVQLLRPCACWLHRRCRDFPSCLAVVIETVQVWGSVHWDFISKERDFDLTHFPELHRAFLTSQLPLWRKKRGKAINLLLWHVFDPQEEVSGVISRPGVLEVWKAKVCQAGYQSCF